MTTKTTKDARALINKYHTSLNVYAIADDGSRIYMTPEATTVFRRWYKTVFGLPVDRPKIAQYKKWFNKIAIDPLQAYEAMDSWQQEVFDTILNRISLG